MKLNSISTNGQLICPLPADLLNRLRLFVQAEAETQYLELDRQWSRPLSERVSKGWTIEGLRVEHFEKGLIRLHCDTNDSRFREGDLLVLHRGNPKDFNALHVELQYDGETELEASLIKGNQYFLAAEPEGWIFDQDWFDSSPFYLDALDTVADSLRGRSIILPLLQGSLIPKIDYARFERASQEIAEAGLNDSQVEAVSQGLCCGFIALDPGSSWHW